MFVAYSYDSSSSCFPTQRRGKREKVKGENEEGVLGEDEHHQAMDGGGGGGDGDAKVSAPTPHDVLYTGAGVMIIMSRHCITDDGVFISNVLT